MIMENLKHRWYEIPHFEEQLSAIYSAINKDETKLKNMKLFDLIEWADFERIF